MISYRLLNKDDFESLHQTLVQAFSDYSLAINPTIDGLRRMYTIEGVNLDYSVGAFEDGKMVGFTANAIGDWQGILTAYDAGTGVIPAYRRRGISRGMFDFLLPFLRSRQIKQYLLEVITKNEPAVRLYQNLGFQIHRDLLVYKRDKAPELENVSRDVMTKEIETPDWKQLESFLTYLPSWQNSIDSYNRSAPDETIKKNIIGLYLGENLIGYGIVFKNSGNVSQMAVAEEYRHRGFGKILLNALQKQTEKPLLLSNIDKKARETAAFLESNGFELLTTQYEMLLKL